MENGFCFQFHHCEIDAHNVVNPKKKENEKKNEKERLGKENKSTSFTLVFRSAYHSYAKNLYTFNTCVFLLLVWLGVDFLILALLGMKMREPQAFFTIIGKK